MSYLDQHVSLAQIPRELRQQDPMASAGPQDPQQNSRTAVDRKVCTNISQSLQTGQPLSEVKNRFCDLPCFYTINDLRKKPYKWYIQSIDLRVKFDRENLT